MDFAEPRLCSVSAATGTLLNGNSHYHKAYRDLVGLYADADAFAKLLESRADEIAYEVTSYTPGNKISDLIMGVTRMAPGKVGREFFLTRGHIHAIGDRPEIYHTLSGHGVLQMEDPRGEVRLVAIGPGEVCYVPPFWIHRSINVGREDLVMFFSYPSDSGQDYGIVERSHGLRVRIMDDGRGGWRQEDNPLWHPRSGAEIAALLARTEART